MREQTKIAVVTGASQGIGAAVSAALSREAYTVVLIARDEERLSAVAASILDAGGKAHAIACDLSDRAAVRSCCERIRNDWGRVDVLVNNAGVGSFGPFLEASEEEIVAPVAVPLLSTMLVSRHLGPLMLARGTGHIVNLLAPSSYAALPYLGAYGAARAGVLSFTRSLRRELGPAGVRVSAYCPAAVDTKYTANNATSLDWYPLLSRYVPRQSAEDVARDIVRLLRTDRGEVFGNLTMRAILELYRLFPGLFFAVGNALGLMQPPALTKKPRG